MNEYSFPETRRSIKKNKDFLWICASYEVVIEDTLLDEIVGSFTLTRLHLEFQTKLWTRIFEDKIYNLDFRKSVSVVR